VTISKRIDIISHLARTKLGQVDDWEVFRLSHTDAGMLVEGAVAPRYTRGPREGERNWKRRDSSTDASTYIPYSDIEAFKAQWERDTGKCSRCMGKGNVVARWTRAHGTEYKPCACCNGTGATQKAGTDEQQ
jgi:hypothetical protein